MQPPVPINNFSSPFKSFSNWLKESLSKENPQSSTLQKTSIELLPLVSSTASTGTFEKPQISNDCDPYNPSKEEWDDWLSPSPLSDSISQKREADKRKLLENQIGTSTSSTTSVSKLTTGLQVSPAAPLTTSITSTIFSGSLSSVSSNSSPTSSSEKTEGRTTTVVISEVSLGRLKAIIHTKLKGWDTDEIANTIKSQIERHKNTPVCPDFWICNSLRKGEFWLDVNKNGDGGLTLGIGTGMHRDDRNLVQLRCDSLQQIVDILQSPTMKRS